MNPSLNAPSFSMVSKSDHVIGFEVKCASGGVLYIDWGDGKITESALSKEYTTINCLNYNPGSTIKVYKNDIVFLNVSNKRLTMLDVSYCPELISLSCHTNQLKYLDLSKNYNLASLNCSNNQLQTLNLTSNKALQYLFCNNNPLIYLNISKNKLLYDLNYTPNSLQPSDSNKNIIASELQFRYYQPFASNKDLIIPKVKYNYLFNIETVSYKFNKDQSTHSSIFTTNRTMLATAG
jgi:hypothetical protein